MIKLKLYSFTNKIIVRVSNMINLGLNKDKIIVSKINKFYRYYLLKSFVIELSKIFDNNSLQYSSIDLERRFFLKSINELFLSIVII